MDMIADLWLPILVSAVAAFFASFLAWTVLPHHKSDFKKLPNESAFQDMIRNSNLSAGVHFFPYCDPKEMKDPEAKKRMETPPFGLLQIWNGKPNMGKNMALSFTFNIVVGVFVAYIASLSTLAPGAGFMPVFQVTGTAAVMAYALGFIPHHIWFGKPMSMTIKDIIDGVAYGLITGAIFAAMWPGAPEVLNGVAPVLPG